MEHTHKHIVLGLGVTGLSVVRYLCAQGFQPLVMDSRDHPPGCQQLSEEFPHVPLITGSFDVRILIQAEQIIINPGIALDTPEVKAASDIGVEVIGDIELFARAIAGHRSKVIGITGSNGKSTVTTLVGEMAKEAGINVAVGGNIGIPVLNLLGSQVDLYVLELSSFQLETTSSLRCIAGTCLNVSADHMDRYDSLNSYCDAKHRLYQQSKICVINRQDPLTEPNHPSHCISFGMDVPESDDWGIVNGYFVRGSSEVMLTSDAAAVGSHNQANILAAMALAETVDISRSAMTEVAKRFQGLAHRCEKISEIQGVTYINDSKATNVGATQAAIDGLKDELGELILIAGGDAKGADLSLLEKSLSYVRDLIVFGKDAPKFAALRMDVHQVETMHQAVEQASKLAGSGDIVLLSPACASLDMYKNFAERGNDFRQEVEKLDGDA